MTPPPNYQEIARRFWDLWQEQATQMMNDKEFIRAMLEMMQTSALHANPDAYAPPHAPSTSRPAPASEPRPDAMDELIRRFDAMEARLCALEDALIGLVGRPSRPPKATVSRARPKRAARKGTRLRGA